MVRRYDGIGPYPMPGLRGQGDPGSCTLSWKGFFLADPEPEPDAVGSPVPDPVAEGSCGSAGTPGTAR